MAIRTEEPDSSTSDLKKRKLDKPSSSTTPKPTPNPFTFWFYFTVSVSLFTLIFVAISSLITHQDPKSWFLTLPTNLRRHYSDGRIIKIQSTPHTDSIEVFTIQSGPIDSSHNVLIIHGLGCSSYTFNNVVKSLGKQGVHAVALDLPGSGFSDKVESVTEEKVIGGFGRIIEMYNEIKEKGLFWGFDQLIEQGYVNYDYGENERNGIRVSQVKTFQAIELGPEEMGRVLGQVIDTLGLSPVDLVLHDSAFNLGANWVSKNLGFVRSVTLLDSSSNQTSFPLWVLRFPIVKEVVLGLGVVFQKVIQTCCSRSSGGFDSESHRLLLKGRDGIKSVAGMGKKMNSSFDVSEWGKLDGIKNLPMQVIWSEEWIEQGHQVADELPQARFITHSGGRWLQEQTSDEIVEHIYEFISRLPKPAKIVQKKEPTRQHIHEELDDASSKVRHHGMDDHGHDHGHGYGYGYGYGQEAGYPSGYGLDH